jgi:hypothetical protein
MSGAISPGAGNDHEERILAGLADPDAELERIVLALGHLPAWEAALKDQATQAAQRTIKSAREAILLLGFRRSHNLLARRFARRPQPAVATTGLEAEA